MKLASIILITLASIATSLVLADETITMTQGTGGRTISVTTNAVRVIFSPYARLCSVVNSGASTVYVATGVTSTEFAAMVASTNATPLIASASYEFVGRDPITSIALQSTSGTNSVVIGVQE